MITDKDIVRVCASSYDPSFKWDVLWDGTYSNGVYAGLAGNVLCFRGSVTAEDWFRDLNAEAEDDNVLGGLHAGFAEGMPEFVAKNVEFLHSDTIVCGHSLGAARALICAGYMIKAGIIPRAIIVFGCPRPGFRRLADTLSFHKCARSYRNRFDEVTTVPRAFPCLPYVDALPFIDLDVKPHPADFDLFLADHHIELYEAGTPPTLIP